MVVMEAEVENERHQGWSTRGSKFYLECFISFQNIIDQLWHNVKTRLN